MESGSLKLANFAILSPAAFRYASALLPVRLATAERLTRQMPEFLTIDALGMRLLKERAIGFREIIPKPTMPARREWKEERMGEEVGE